MIEVISLSGMLVMLILAYRGERAYRSLPILAALQTRNKLPSLSIIIPARNEAHHLPKLLGSLRELRYPGELEIIVVDDHSTDSTAQVAAENGAVVLSIPELPHGWLGKPHACERGAQAARGEFFLFTDADTLHAPQSAGVAVACVLEHDLDGLSMFLEQKPHSIIDGSTLAVAFAGLYAGRGARAGLLNGQYILLSRRAYFGSGGFSRVRDHPLEDVALGKELERAGYRVALMRGQAWASVQMYQGLPQLWNGLTRLGSGALGETGRAAWLTVLFVTLCALPLILAAPFWMDHRAFLWLLVWGSAAVTCLPWARRVGSVGLCLLAPPAAMLMIAAAVSGIIQRFTKRGNLWKGRRV